MMFNYKSLQGLFPKVLTLHTCSLWYLDQLTYLEAIVKYNGKLTEDYSNAYEVSMISFFNSSFTLLYIL